MKTLTKILGLVHNKDILVSILLTTSMQQKTHGSIIQSCFLEASVCLNSIGNP